MNKLNLNEIKKIELEILTNIDDFCRKNKITYFLDGGTCLGAIRHHGFIPWDDDIDICMKRKDYEKFIAMYCDEKYVVLNYPATKDYYYSFAKVVDNNTCVVEKGLPKIKELGVWVDIFPLDGLPENYTKRKLFQHRIINYRRIINTALVNKKDLQNFSPYKKILYKFLRLYGWQKAIKKLNRILIKSSKKNKRRVFDMVAAFRPFGSVPSECFEDQLYIVFEGKKFPVPSGYDVYLTELYGNYMELPPMEKRVSNHNYIAFRK